MLALAKATLKRNACQEVKKESQCVEEKKHKVLVKIDKIRNIKNSKISHEGTELADKRGML